MSAPAIDLWFDFASIYSYLTVMRVGPLAREAGVTVRFRPFLLGPIFKAQGWDNSPFNIYPAKGRYMWRDVERLCAELGLPLRKPDPVPQNSILAARVALAVDDDRRGDFTRAVFHAEFGEGKAIKDRVLMEALLGNLGLDVDAVMDRAQSVETKNRLRAETDEAMQLGIFGAPTFITPDGEMFWGNDRLEPALAWAKRGNTQKTANRP